MKIRKESRVARMDWASGQLSQDQNQYAAEDAYFSFMLYDKLWNLPNPEWGTTHSNHGSLGQGVLTMQEGWEENGIIRRVDGLYCKLCDKGPMTVPLAVEKHIESKDHKKRFKSRENG